MLTHVLHEILFWDNQTWDKTGTDREPSLKE